MPKETALITGASAGIGRDLARVFAANGHDLCLVARRRDRLQELASTLRSEHGVSVEVFARDLAPTSSAQTLFNTLERRGIQIDVLVNNAGMLQEGQFSDTPLDEHLALLQLNLLAPTSLMRLFLGPMLDRGHGRILNVASIAGFQPLAGLGVYAAAKAYLLHLSEALSEELQGTGVTISALCPGFTDTGMMSEMPESLRVPSFAISSSEDVANDGYRACMEGTPVYVSGAANQWFTEMVRFQPRWLVRAMTGMMSRRSR